MNRKLTLFLLPRLSTLDPAPDGSPARCSRLPKARCVSSAAGFHCAIAASWNWGFQKKFSGKYSITLSHPQLNHLFLFLFPELGVILLHLLHLLRVDFDGVGEVEQALHVALNLARQFFLEILKKQLFVISGTFFAHMR